MNRKKCRLQRSSIWLMIIPFIFLSQDLLQSGTLTNSQDTKNKMARKETIQKVIKAMLAMQRRAWEQGVASQALLELGETEWVILLARDAVVNQWKDGRLGLNGQDRPVADPASNGEPVLFAAKATGDEKLKTAAEQMLNFLLYKAPKTREGIIYHN